VAEFIELINAAQSKSRDRSIRMDELHSQSSSDCYSVRMHAITSW
jgi:hypothetical protein